MTERACLIRDPLAPPHEGEVVEIVPPPYIQLSDPPWCCEGHLRVLQGKGGEWRAVKRRVKK